MITIAFVLNPIAGMGGKVGLKGTDNVLEEAIERGAKPRSPDRAREAISRFAEAFSRHRLEQEVRWLCPSGPMGEDLLRSMKVPLWTISVICGPGPDTTAEDTKEFVTMAVVAGADLIVFCGGDGTARDVFSRAGKVPMFGIPAGVKMHSGVFAVDPRTAGELLEFYVRGEMIVGPGEVMDLDEERYRHGEWNIALFGIARTLSEPSFVQSGKLMVEEESIEDVVAEIAGDLKERIQGGIAILGPGGTMEGIGRALGIEKTLLGVDVISNGSSIASDCTEEGILKLLDVRDAGYGRSHQAYIIVSPIGGQGFILGRGNLQISPEVVRRVGTGNLIVVSTPHKLETTRVIRVDTGDAALDREIRSRGSVKVLTGYRTYRLVKME